MISYNGWDREYESNYLKYQTLFDDIMSKDHDTKEESFERSIAGLIGRQYAVAVSNATDALYFSLIANGIGEGDEVLVSNFSWISSATCIVRAGANPVFCDIDLETYHMSLDSIKRMHSDKVKAIVYTHLYGSMTDTTEIENFCKQNGILFIEDAAQSLGSSLDGRKAGTIGDVSSFSFNSNKVIAGIAGGGVLLTDDKDIADEVSSLRKHGKSDYGFELSNGINSKMYYFNSEIIKFRLTNMSLFQVKRNEIAKEYDKAFKRSPIIIQKNDRTLQHNYHKYVVRFEDTETRDFVINNLKRNKIDHSIHYDKPISENPVFSDYTGYRKDETPNAEKASSTVLSLPIHPFLTKDEINKVIKSVMEMV